MSVKVRFAPSPTGNLHAGNVRTALINYLLAHREGGSFFLRMDDTDAERSKEEYERGIVEDLRWLGLDWNGDVIRQRDRFDLYESAKKQLVENGHLYPCYETPEELEIRRKMQAGRGLPPVYDRAALTLTDAQKHQYAQEGRQPHWRFRLGEDDIVFDDLIRGEVRFTPGHISDPVLIRADGVPLYTLSSVVDDGEMAISHILRGEDHVTNTAVQVQIFQALGYRPPRFGHNALLKMKDGKLSKRTGGGDIRSLRDAGIEPMAINSYLAKIGTSDAIEVYDNMQALIESFDLGKFGRAMANYDVDELIRLNDRLLSQLPFEQVRTRLEAMGIEQPEEHFWLSVRDNIATLPEVRDWWEILHRPLTPQIENADFTRQAATLLPEGAWTEESFKHWTDAVKEATGQKGKALFMPLRKALTGREDGPELKHIFALIDREKVVKRLNGDTA